MKSNQLRGLHHYNVWSTSRTLRLAASMIEKRDARCEIHYLTLYSLSTNILLEFVFLIQEYTRRHPQNSIFSPVNDLPWTQINSEFYITTMSGQQVVRNVWRTRWSNRGVHAVKYITWHCIPYPQISYWSLYFLFKNTRADTPKTACDHLLMTFREL